VIPCKPTVRIRLGTGISFGAGFVLGSVDEGILGTNVLASSLVDYIDISDQVTRIATRHGRDRVFNNYTASSSTVQFLDFTGDWNPANQSGPYYGEILPMRQLQISCDYQGTNYALYSGYITSWDYEWADQSADYALVTVQAVDAFRILQLVNITSVTGASTHDLPGERIGQILDEVGWPVSARDLDIGTTELLNDPGTTRTALSAIQVVEESDLGAFYIANDGTAVYRSRVSLSQQGAGTPYYFDDTGTNIQYQGLDINFDETELANDITFASISGPSQNVFDQNSIDNYFVRTYERSDLMTFSNSDVLAQANRVLNYRKTPRLRIDSIKLDLSSDSNRVLPALAAEIGQPIVVTKTMAANTQIDLRITIQGHSHDITPDSWVTTFSTAYPLATAFVLGSSEFGILGTNTF